MNFNIEFGRNCGILEENLEMVFLSFEHEIGHRIENKLYIWVRGAMGNNYLRNILESRCVSLGFDFVDFSGGIENCY